MTFRVSLCSAGELDEEVDDDEELEEVDEVLDDEETQEVVEHATVAGAFSAEKVGSSASFCFLFDDTDETTEPQPQPQEHDQKIFSGRRSELTTWTA